MARDFDWDEGAILALGRSPQMTGITRAATERIADEARRGAPVDTGDYQDSIRVVPLPGDDRNRFGVVAEDDKSLLIEARTGNLNRSTGRARR